MLEIRGMASSPSGRGSWIKKPETAVSSFNCSYEAGELFLCYVSREAVDPGLYPDLLAVALFGGDVGNGGGVLADEDHVEPHGDAPFSQPGDLGGDLGADLGRRCFAVQYFRHASPRGPRGVRGPPASCGSSRQAGL